MEADHAFFLKASGDLFIKSLIQFIEGGKIRNIKAMDPVEVIKVYLSNQFILYPGISMLVAFISLLVLLFCLANLLIICLILGSVKDSTEHNKIEHDTINKNQASDDELSEADHNEIFL